MCVIRLGQCKCETNYLGMGWEATVKKFAMRQPSQPNKCEIKRVKLRQHNVDGVFISRKNSSERRTPNAKAKLSQSEWCCWWDICHRCHCHCVFTIVESLPPADRFCDQCFVFTAFRRLCSHLATRGKKCHRNMNFAAQTITERKRRRAVEMKMMLLFRRIFVKNSLPPAVLSISLAKWPAINLEMCIDDIIKIHSESTCAGAGVCCFWLLHQVFLR